MAKQRTGAPYILAGIIFVGIIAATAFFVRWYSLRVTPTPLLQQTSLSPTTQQTIKTYTNSYFGYSYSYPSTWETYALYQIPANTPNDKISERFLRPVGSDAAEIDLEVLSGQPGSENSLIQTVQGYTWENKKTSTLTIDDAKATKITGTDQGREFAAVIFQHGNYVYHFHSLGGYVDILDQVLASFSFTK